MAFHTNVIHHEKITPYDFAAIFNNAYVKAANLAKGISGFASAGIFPLDPKKFTEEDFAVRLEVEQRLPVIEDKYVAVGAALRDTSISGVEDSPTTARMDTDMNEDLTPDHIDKQHYASLRWNDSKDLHTAIMRLVCQLTDLMLDAEHSTNNDMHICWDDNEVGRIRRLIRKYEEGQKLCTQYLQEDCTIEQFCSDMINYKLRSFLYEIARYNHFEHISTT
ncbi:unnamed protein product [Acanthoscelides obtectus]|uniref:Uncharacterized protein n=1 Tax=Acanthoscelides obtectus TaxID=200917 RepID=A0A9P0PWJ9_ACAOB|nr:unnamed protein product [Acanthoscelides obtectus]CAK1641080.1 hypothetical protein AOBTE_LOCUS12135 [Acanthoscelides obtectus]